VPILVYAGPFLGLYGRGRATPGPNTGLAVRRARNLLLVRWGIALPFWLAVAVAMAGGQAVTGVIVSAALTGAFLCWVLSIWRAGQVPRPLVQALPRHAGR
jgi:hypothetical protein